MNLTNDKLTALKIIALFAMFIDHYNKFANSGLNQILFNIGRLALPIFLFVIAFNLSRMKVETMPTTAARLLFFGLLAVIPYSLMGGTILNNWWPLNVLFLLAGLVLIVYFLTIKPANKIMLHCSRITAILIFLVSGAIAEFFWVGLGFGLLVWKAFKLFSRSENERGRVELAFITLGIGLSFFLLHFVNGNSWALASIPVIALVLLVKIPKLPRLKWFFYWFYPVHLWLILCASRFVS